MANFIANLLGLAPAAPVGGDGRSNERLSIREANAASPPVPSYSFAQLQQLYNKLSQFRESDLEKGAGDAVVETVRQITEALIWGEQNDTNFFDFFCEKSILADFIRVLGLLQAPKQVKVQLLQTLSMLVQNIRRQTSVYYLLSGNYVNRLITIPLDFNDEEILAYYITLLKSLAMRLDNETVKFFFLQHPETSFPLYIEAAKFFSHRDQMVRAAVRTITLQVYRIDDKAMQRFVLRHAKEVYFKQLAAYLRDLWLRFNAAAHGVNGEEDLAQLQHRNDLQQDLLLYLSDVFDLEVQELNEVLADRLLNGIMLSVLLPSITGAAPPGAGGSPTSMSIVELGGDLPSGNVVFQQPVALFLLRQVFDTFHSRELVEPIASALLHHYAGPANADGYPDSSRREDTSNPLREHFMRCLRSNDDTIFLLASAVVHSCLTKSSKVLSTEFLEKTLILPSAVEKATPSPSEASTTASSSVGKASNPAEKSERKGFMPRLSFNRGSSSSTPSKASGVEPPASTLQATSPVPKVSEVLTLLLQGLQRHSSWQMEDFQVFVRIMLDVLLDPGVCHHQKTQAAIQETLQLAVKSSAQHVRRLLQGSDDSVLDVLLEEWDLHKMPLGSVSDICSNPRILVPSTSSSHGGMRRTASGMTTVAERQGQKAIRHFLLLRRLQRDVAQFTPQVRHDRRRDQSSPPWATTPLSDSFPVQVPEELMSGLSEDMTIEVGAMERIVCSLATAHGKQTRYLLIHDYWLLLVQPDLTMMGWAVIKTLWPIRSVQSIIDRSDPRTLRIGMHTLRGTGGNGEASVNRSTELSSVDRPGMYLTLTLNFEDVRRCHSADVHLHKRRQEIRAQLMQKAAAFIDEHA